MFEFLSKNRVLVIAGGAVLVLVVFLNGPDVETPTPDTTGSVSPATISDELSSSPPSRSEPTADARTMFMPPPFKQRDIVPPVEGDPLP